MNKTTKNSVVLRALCVSALAGSTVCVAEPLTNPGQLTPGNALISFESVALGPTGVVFNVQCTRFSSPQGMSIVDLSAQPYSGPLVGGHGLHPLPGAIGSGLYINTNIVFDPPVAEVGMGWWDPNSAGSLLRVYDVNGAFLEEVAVPTQPPGGTGASFVGIRRPTREIALAICYPGSSADTYVLDNISFGPYCKANCDCSSSPPALNANDFNCFLNKFASGEDYANCDGSTTPPVLNANDFLCFLNAFASGCT
jgi:hypothetical protein